MLNRILHGWTFIRALYLVMGLLIVGQAIFQKQSIGLVFGGYIASMGLFGFGCAGGNCITGNLNSGGKADEDLKALNDVEFEEIKTK